MDAVTGYGGARRMSRQENFHRGMISIKGVIWHEDSVVLLKNQRDEWELPGGKLEVGESFAACLAREIDEELGLQVELGPILDAGPHHVYADIVVITYGCYPEPFATLRHTDEHHAVGRFTLAELEGLPMADGYRSSISTWVADPRSRRSARTE
ncbi:MAG: NUDIX domain-containing protein [Dehalococcoidia bacterium]